MPGPKNSSKKLLAKTPQQPLAVKKRTSVSNSITLDVENPIPFEYGGMAFSFLQGQQYIPFLSPGDDFARMLLEAKTLSATHTACIETKKTYCAGRGLIDKDGNEFDPDLVKWLKRMNVKGESQIQINKKAFGSFFTFGNVPCEVVRFTVAGKKKICVYIHNFLEWRLGWPDADGNITKAIQSKLFLKTGVISSDALKNAKVLPIYDPERSDKKNWLKDANGTERTLIWIKNDVDGYSSYGMPSSVATLIYQILEYKHARFNLDEIQNNMVIGGILGMKGNVSQEEATRIAKEIIKTHTGDGKRGRIAAVASEEGVDGFDFMQYDTKKDGSFVEADDKVMAKIILGNEWSAMLAGLSHESAMGRGNAFLKKDYEIRRNTVINPAQEFMIMNLWMPIMQIASEWLGNQWNEYDLDIHDIDPISSMADVDPTPVIKVNELRRSINLPDDESPKGEMYIGELTTKKPTSPAGGEGNV